MRFVFQLHLVVVTDFIELNPVPFVPMSLAKVSCADDTAAGAVTEKDKKKGEKKDLSILLDFSKNHLLVY